MRRLVEPEGAGEAIAGLALLGVLVGAWSALCVGGALAVIYGALP